MFDIKAVEAEAKAEIAKEQSLKAKDCIKASLRKIASAEAIVANLKREHEVILREAESE